MVQRHTELLRPAAGDTILDAGAVLRCLTSERQAFALGELFRVLRPGGLLAITVFAHEFRPSRVYAETLRERRRSEGIVSTIGLGVRYLVNTIRIFYYVWRIKRTALVGDYRFATGEECGATLRSTGFTVADIEPTMAGQCWAAFAVKPSNGSCP